MNDDYYCLGWDSAGFITHVTMGTELCCKTTAKQIRGYYKSVKVVDFEVGQRLIDADYKEWFKQYVLQGKRDAV